MRRTGTTRVWIAGAAVAALGVAAPAAAGSLDGTLGTGGIVHTDVGTSNTLRDVAVQADGKLVLSAITGSTSGSHAAALRLNPDGSFGTTWGTGGVGTQFFTLLEGNARLATGADGRLVIAGHTSNPREW